MMQQQTAYELYQEKFNISRLNNCADIALFNAITLKNKKILIVTNKPYHLDNIFDAIDLRIKYSNSLSALYDKGFKTPHPKREFLTDCTINGYCIGDEIRGLTANVVINYNPVSFSNEEWKNILPIMSGDRLSAGKMRLYEV